MILLRTALKNILSNGRRAWLNVIVLSFTFGVMLFYGSVMDGWVSQSKNDAREWECADGQVIHPSYDRYDPFTLSDAHGVVPPTLAAMVDEGQLEPLLICQASLYPKGRMINVQLKGMRRDQSIVSIPTQALAPYDAEPIDAIPVLIGRRMAEMSRLSKGDRVMMRWRDGNGMYDARRVRIDSIFDSPSLAVDNGVIWMELEQLRDIAAMPDEVTYLLKQPSTTLPADLEGWRFESVETLIADILLFAQSERVEMCVIIAILLSIALLAVFDTQMLSIFRRQREIGTYIALGMTPRQVMGLFTLEGTLYSLLAVVATSIWETPLLVWVASAGIDMGEMIEASGRPIAQVIYPSISMPTLTLMIVVLLLFSALISYLPTRRIARQSIVTALKGKIS